MMMMMMMTMMMRRRRRRPTPDQRRPAVQPVLHQLLASPPVAGQLEEMVRFT